ncbi:MAG: hypothetical protein QXI87_06020 [Thermoproteota archaeon]
MSHAFLTYAGHVENLIFLSCFIPEDIVGTHLRGPVGVLIASILGG